jgi:dTDP-4-amino-4,6-dideoxygalactose transaminase
MRIVFHLYSVFAEHRDELLYHCQSHGIEAKVHYPIPIYRQQALKAYDIKTTFPVTDWLAANSISFPCDQHLSMTELEEIVSTVESFYEKVK